MTETHHSKYNQERLIIDHYFFKIVSFFDNDSILENE